MSILLCSFIDMWKMIGVNTFFFLTNAVWLHFEVKKNKFSETILNQLIACVPILITTWFIHWVLIKSFLLQKVAENSHNALTTIFDSLPDAVVLLSLQYKSKDNTEESSPDKHETDGTKSASYELHYCNKKTDQVFGVSIN